MSLITQGQFSCHALLCCALNCFRNLRTASQGCIKWRWISGLHWRTLKVPFNHTVLRLQTTSQSKDLFRSWSGYECHNWIKSLSLGNKHPDSLSRTCAITNLDFGIWIDPKPQTETQPKRSHLKPKPGEIARSEVISY